MGDSDCSETVADEDVSPTASPALLQLPSPKEPPTHGAGFISPAYKSLVGVTGVTEVNDEVNPSETCGSPGKVAESEGHESHDVLERVVAAAEVNAISTPERCYRPVERARERRRLRLEESQRSSVLSAWEQERVYLRCVQCNYKFTDSDWSQFKSEGWDVEVIKLCNPCIDSMIEHE